MKKEGKEINKKTINTKMPRTLELHTRKPLKPETTFSSRDKDPSKSRDRKSK